MTPNNLDNLKEEIVKEFGQLCPGYQITDWSGKNPQTLPMMVQKEDVKKLLSLLHSRYLEAFREMVEKTEIYSVAVHPGLLGKELIDKDELIASLEEK